MLSGVPPLRVDVTRVLASLACSRSSSIIISCFEKRVSCFVLSFLASLGLDVFLHPFLVGSEVIQSTGTFSSVARFARVGGYSVVFEPLLMVC